VSIAIRIALSPDLGQQDRADLLGSLSRVGFVHDDQARHFGPDFDWQSFLIIAGGAGELANYALRLSKLAREILYWREEIRRKKSDPAAVLTRPGADPLDLRTADDEAVEKWITAAEQTGETEPPAGSG
jgi:hypothetical protein